MGLFKTPPTEAELEQQKRYEEAKIRVLKLHEAAELLFYIDQVTEENGHQILGGELAQGTLDAGCQLSIYSCEGILLGGMTVAAVDQREERISLFEKVLHTDCTPKEDWSGYLPGQMLIKTKTDHVI